MDTAKATRALSRAARHPIIVSIISQTTTTMASLKNLVQATMRTPIKSTAGIIVLIGTPWLLRKMFRRLSVLFNGVPGPALPKLTGYWKKLHLVRGTYVSTLAKLHRKYGLIVQTGESEYSVNDISMIPFWWRLERSTAPDTFPMRSLHPKTAEAVITALSMRSICHYESVIDKCTANLLERLSLAAPGEPVQLTDAIQRYVFDVLFEICAGNNPGFLDRAADPTELINAMEKWQSYTFPNSVLRLFPRINQYLRKRFDFRSSFENAIRSYLPATESQTDSAIALLLKQDGMTRENAIDACTAIIMVGAGPLISHLQSTLVHICDNEGDKIYESEEGIKTGERNSKGQAPETVNPDKADSAIEVSNNTNLVEQLREEMESMRTRKRLSQLPTLRELVHGRIRMPLLHAVMREALRLQQPLTNSVRLVVPKGGIIIVDVLIPENSILVLEPSIINAGHLFRPNSEKLKPSRWLESSPNAREMSEHMIAFGAGASICPGYNLHTAIITKLLTQLIQAFDIKMAVLSKLAPIVTANLPAISITSPISAYFTAREFFPKTPKTPATPGEHSKAPPAEPAAEKVTVPAAVTAVNDIADSKSESIAPPATNVTGEKSAGKKFFGNYTAIGFWDVDRLKLRLGEEDANAVLDLFNPDEKLTPRRMYTLEKMEDSYHRAKAHEVLTEIYGDRLIHETGRKDNRMRLWVPGSPVPDWLRKLHASRSLAPVPMNNRDKTEKRPATTTTQASKTHNGNNTHGNKTYNNNKTYGNKSDGYKGQPELRAPRDPLDITKANGGSKGWQGFALGAPTQYLNDAAAAAADIAPRAPAPEYKCKETFKPCKVKKDEEPAPAPERKSALPPHLRKKAEAAEAAEN